MKNLIKSGPLLVVMMFVMSSFVRNKSVELRINLSEGSQIETSLTIDAVSFSLDLGEAAGSTTKMAYKITQTVESKEKDTYKMKSVFNSMSVAMEQGGGNSSYNSEDYDSTDTFQARMHELVGGMIGKPILETINTRGESIGKPDYSAFNEEMVKNMQLDQMQSNLNFVLPENKVKVGDSWTVTREENANGMLKKVNTIYTVSDIKKREVLLSVSGDISGEGDLQGIKASIKGTQKGTAIVDRKHGVSLSSNVIQNTNIAMSMQGQDMNMSVTTTITSTSEVKE